MLSLEFIFFSTCVSLVVETRILRIFFDRMSVPQNHRDWLMCLFVVQKYGKIDNDTKKIKGLFF